MNEIKSDPVNLHQDLKKQDFQVERFILKIRAVPYIKNRVLQL